MAPEPEIVETVELTDLDEVGEQLKNRVAELEQQVSEFNGPVCLTPDCPDYDGYHPYHQNAVSNAWNQAQAQTHAWYEDQIRQYKAEAESVVPLRQAITHTLNDFQIVRAGIEAVDRWRDATAGKRSRHALYEARQRLLDVMALDVGKDAASRIAGLEKALELNVIHDKACRDALTLAGDIPRGIDPLAGILMLKEQRDAARLIEVDKRALQDQLTALKKVWSKAYDSFMAANSEVDTLDVGELTMSDDDTLK